MANNELRISTDNNNNGIRISIGASKNSDADIKINNNNVEYYEKQAAKYSTQAKERAKDCEKYVSEAQNIANDCKNITEELKQSFDEDLNAHIDDTDNPHKVTAEQLDVYTKAEIDAKYLSEQQNISGKANKSDLAPVATSGSYKDLSDKPIIPDGAVIDSELSETSNNSVANRIVTQALNSKQDKISDIDTIRAGAHAGATALQSIPDEYITESKLTQKGYLTKIPDTYALKTDIPDVTTKQDKLTIDTALDATSNNLVTNSAITESLENYIKKDFSNCTIPYINTSEEPSQIESRFANTTSRPAGNGDESAYIYIPYLSQYQILFQWGSITNDEAIAKSAHWTGTITLPKTYRENYKYQVYLNCIGDGTSKILRVYCQSQNPTSLAFDVYNQSTAATKAGVRVSWLTIGRVFDADWWDDGT